VQDDFPAWLKSPPDGDFPSTPVDTRAQTLPFGELTWENFERLIVRVVRREATISKCWVYGTKGQKQHGLDILAAKDEVPGEFACYQCKRVDKFTAGKIKDAVDTFLKGEWVGKTKCFILCSSLALDGTKQVKAITTQHSRLAKKGIDFDVWDGSEGGKLSEQLKSYPDLVDDFFHREWVCRFNGKEASEQLGKKLHGAQLAELRSQLKDVYATLFLRHDQGLRLNSQYSAPLLDRYVAPFVIETREIVTTEQAPKEQTQKLSAPKREEQNFPDGKKRPPPSPPSCTSSIHEIRIPIGEWLSQHNKTVILGDPGYGKSALLRVITLQLMNNRDDLFRLPWGELLPVWVSFGGFSAAIQEQPNLSLKDYFDMWLHKNGADDARPLFRRAVKQGKMLLLVDGLDEGTDVNAAKQAMDRISAFLSIHVTPALYTSRPRGYKKVGPDETWPVARLDSFDEDQIECFSQIWFEYLEAPEAIVKDGEKGYLLNAKQRTRDFLKAVRSNLQVMDLARTPLFCQLLIDIFRYSHHLPEQRFKVYEKIVEMLLSDHPASRIYAAGLTRNKAPRFEDMREMLMSLALHIEEKGGAGIISTVECKALFCKFLTDVINGPGLSKYDAKHQAQSIVDHAQIGLGLIVERATDELGFFHLTIQEYLAAQAMVRKDEDEQLAWLAQFWNEPKWHEVVLAWFSIRGSNQGKGATLKAIESLKKLAVSSWDQLQLILLRTELAANDLGLSPQVARSTIEEAAGHVETSPYPELRQALARQITLGLRTSTIANCCEARISNWIPGRSEWDRASLLQELGNWQLSDDLLDTLKLALHDESLRCRRAAAKSLAKVFSGDLTIGNDLSVMATNWPDTAVRASAMYCLWKGWPDHEALLSLTDNACCSKDLDLVLTGVDIRVSKEICDENDREKIWFMFVNGNVSYELKDKCREVLVRGWGKDTEFKRQALEGLKNPYSSVMRGKDQFVSFLAHAWPGDKEVARSIAQYFSSFSPFHTHDDSLWDALFVGFRGNADLSKVLRKAFSEYQSKYKSIQWGPDAKRLFCTIGDEAAKSELIEAYLTETGSQGKFWICSALMKAWSNDSEVNEFLGKEFLKPPNEVAFLGKWVSIFIPEREAQRYWLLEAIKNPEPGLAIGPPVNQLLHEFHDEECLIAVKTVLTKDIWYYHKVDFQSKLIEIFPNDDEVQEWVEMALVNSDGPSIDSIAVSHEKNQPIRSRLLVAARPAKADVRAEVFQVLREHQISGCAAQQLTAEIWAEGNGSVRTAGVLARCIAIQQLAELKAPLVEKLHEELNSSGTYYEERRRSSFCGLLQLGEYEACIDALKENASSLHWLAAYHKADSLVAHTLFEHWDELEKNSQTLGRSFEVPWGGFIYNGTAREALVNETTRAQLIDHLKAIPSQDRSSESLTLMAELLPGSSELRACLIETIKKPSNNVNGWEAQRIYAEQFGGEEQALSELKDLRFRPVKNGEESLLFSPYLFAMVLGWPDNQELRSLLQQGPLPKLPIPTVLAICAINKNEEDVSGCINMMIDITLERGFPLPNSYIYGLRKWASSLNAEKLLQHLIADSDYSRKISAIRLFSITGKLSDTARLKMINSFDEALSDIAKNSPDGIDLIDGNVTTLPQVLVRTFLFGET